MTLYGQFGIQPVINLWGTATQYGGPILSPDVAKAMAEAGQHCAKPEDIQAAASRYLAKLSGAEAGYITCGTFSGLMLGAAACLAKLDLKRMEQLPDTSDMPHEFILSRYQRCGWDRAIRAAGGKIVEVGVNERLIGAARGVEAWEYEEAITEKTVALVFIGFSWNARIRKEVEELVAIGERHGIPVLLDAASAATPLTNLRQIVESGVALASFSGGKGLRGPQNSGFILGKKELIASAALQHLDMVGSPTAWTPPSELIPPGAVAHQPRQGIGRGMKVSKETMMGLLVRIKNVAERGLDEENAAMDAKLVRIADALRDLPDLDLALFNRSADGSGDTPAMELRLGKGYRADDICAALKQGSPAICVNEKKIPENIITITAMNLPDALLEPVRSRLRHVLLEARAQ